MPYALRCSISYSISELRLAGKLATRPCIGLLQEHNTRKGFFEADQFGSLVSHLPDYLQPVIQTAYYTGWRIISEILTRQRRHLDLAAGWLRLEPGEDKNGSGRMFPFIRRLRAIIEAQLKRTEEFERSTGRIVPWLFHHDGEPIRTFRRTWLFASKRAGLAGKIPHDFRRTAMHNLERA